MKLIKNKLKLKNRKISAALLIFVSVLFCGYSQETTYTAGMNQNDNRIRSADEGFAAEEFRRGVQAYYKGA